MVEMEWSDEKEIRKTSSNSIGSAGLVPISNASRGVARTVSTRSSASANRTPRRSVRQA